MILSPRVAGPVVVRFFPHLITSDNEVYLMPSTVVQVVRFMAPSWVPVTHLPLAILLLYGRHVFARGGSGLMCQRISSLHDPYCKNRQGIVKIDVSSRTFFWDLEVLDDPQSVNVTLSNQPIRSNQLAVEKAGRRFFANSNSSQLLTSSVHACLQSTSASEACPRSSTSCH